MKRLDLPLDPTAVGRAAAAPPAPQEPDPPPVASAPAPVPLPGVDAFELSTLLAAEALDVRPSRLRETLAKLVPLWRVAGLTLEDVHRRLTVVTGEEGS